MYYLDLEILIQTNLKETPRQLKKFEHYLDSIL